MTIEANASAETPMAPDAPRAAATALPWFRVFYWSVRRELWEHRSVWIAPAAVVVVALFGYLISLHGLPRVIDHLAAPATARNAGRAIAIPYAFVAFAGVMTGLIVALFYCTGALHGERRDRSILFWKSLPVSDLTTVLSKAAIPLVVTPPILFAVIFVAQLVMLAASALVALASGHDLQTLWARTPILDLWRMLGEGLPYIAAWYAPLFAWLMLVSAWAKRVPFLWAVVPPLALALVERLALGTSYVAGWLKLRVAGAFLGAMGHHDGPGWLSPEMWIGLALAAAFLAAAVRLRRSGDPI